MKFVCLGYFDEAKFETMSPGKIEGLTDECLAYDDELRRKGHPVSTGEALQASRNAVTLRWGNGKVIVTDGPYAETKEQIGGFGVIEAADLGEAVRLMSAHPSVKTGDVEIRPVADLAPLIEASERRRGKRK